MVPIIGRAFILDHTRFASKHRCTLGLSLEQCNIERAPTAPPSRIFQRFLLVTFIEKLKTRVENLKIEKIIAFDKYIHELFFAFYYHLSKNLFLTIKNYEVTDLTHFSTKCGCF